MKNKDILFLFAVLAIIEGFGFSVVAFPDFREIVRKWALLIFPIMVLLIISAVWYFSAQEEARKKK